jgi:hypothetical protein
MPIGRTRQVAAALVALLALAASACSSGHPAASDAGKAVRSASVTARSPAASSSPSPSSSAAEITSGGGLIWPPFGKNAIVEISSYLPADPSLRQAVIAAKNFQLAFLYAEYTGGQDNQWQQYVGSQALVQQVGQGLSQPDVTTESYTGTIVISDMNASIVQGGASVGQCWNDAGASNTSLSTGAVLPASEQNTTDENYLFQVYELEMYGGQWKLSDITPPMYYPTASWCKPS